MFTDTFENVFPSNYPPNPRQGYNGGDKFNDEKFIVKLDVAQFKPMELVVKVDGNKLSITGKHQNKNKNGFENCDFLREYDIPSNVETDTISSRITSTGMLIVEDNDAVDISDPCNFHIYVNIAGYKPEEVSVKLVNNDLVVEGKRTNEVKSDDGKRKLKSTSGFIYTFVLPSDIDVNNLVPKFTSSDRLDIEAPKNRVKNECREKNLEIKNGNK